LNQATVDSLLARGVDLEHIAAIDTFLLHHNNGSSSFVSGDSAMTYLLLGVVSSPNDLFVTAANMMEYLEPTTVGQRFSAKIDLELDSVLQQANMDKFIDLNLSELAQGVPISKIEFDMDIKSTMPFKINFSANFVKADSVSVQDVFDNEFLEKRDDFVSLPHFKKEGGALSTTIDETKRIRLQVDCSKNGRLSSDKLRTLGATGIIIRNMRVKVQVGMSGLINQ
jgi:hypothetical protein